MGAGRIIVAGAIVGGGFYAYKAGYLDSLFAAKSAPVGGGQGGQLNGPFLPASQPATGLNRWEQVLLDNWAYVSPWARSNVKWVAAMIKQESGTQGSAARGGAGEVGLMQVKPATAVEMKNRGYGELAATVEVLGTDRGGVYFGCAYLQYLSGINPDRAWITKAYNGGPGWGQLGSAYQAARERYYTEVLAKFNSMYGGGMI